MSDRPAVRRFGDEKIRAIAELKRLKELFRADPEFRHTALNDPAALNGRYEDLGISIDPAALEQIWRRARLVRDDGRAASTTTRSELEELWLGWQEKHREELEGLEATWSSSPNARVKAWRQRQIASARDELGMAEGVGFFPFLAYELSHGCSVQCWFCCFDAEKLRGHVGYSGANARLWQGILQTGLDLFGPLSRQAVCYHATDPFDNPDYNLFLADFVQITGLLPQTTTALPLKDLHLTRELLALRRKNPGMLDRFSILSLAQLRRIYREFSPWELRHVHLVLQNRDSLLSKASTGRAREHPQRLAAHNRAPQDFLRLTGGVEPLTVECICGYLVNLVERRVELIRPCAADEEWPNGYRILARGTFRDLEEYRSFLTRTQEAMMPEYLEWSAPVAFRRDLRYAQRSTGFSLLSRAHRHDFDGPAWYRDLGDVIAGGSATQAEIVSSFSSAGVSTVEVAASLQKLFGKGLLEEESPSAGR